MICLACIFNAMNADALTTQEDRAATPATPIQEGNMGKGEQLVPWGSQGISNHGSDLNCLEHCGLSNWRDKPLRINQT